MENIFKNPTKYIEELRKIQFVDAKREVEFSGKSIAVIFPTKYCNADCKFCIFKSPKKMKDRDTRKNELDELGIQKSIEFINKSNIGYLLISGGGEPFLRLNHLLKLIENVNVDDIVIVSNGFWASNYNKALEILDKIKEIQTKGQKKITIRVSIDKWHAENLGVDHIKNIIELFSKNFKTENELKLKLHTITNDNTIYEVLSKYNYTIKSQKQYSSDNATLLKSNRNRIFLEFDNGYELEIEFAKLFNPNLKVDLNNNIEKQIEIFMEDLDKSQIGNFSTVINADNTRGLDFLINYNGNISTWANYQISNSPNLYTDNYNDIINKIYTDVISYSFLRENLKDIIKIVDKINPIAVKRAIGINIRDYFGMYLLYENKTLLYYYVKILKKYIKEELIINFEQIPNDVKEVIKLDDEKIIELYNKSEYSIINQYKEKLFIKEEWEDLFFLISKKHFILNENQIKEAVEYYNLKTNQSYTNYENIIKSSDKNRDRRLYKRFNM